MTDFYIIHSAISFLVGSGVMQWRKMKNKKAHSQPDCYHTTKPYSILKDAFQFNFHVDSLRSYLYTPHRPSIQSINCQIKCKTIIIIINALLNLYNTCVWIMDTILVISIIHFDFRSSIFTRCIKYLTVVINI